MSNRTLERKPAEVFNTYNTSCNHFSELLIRHLLTLYPSGSSNLKGLVYFQTITAQALSTSSCSLMMVWPGRSIEPLFVPVQAMPKHSSTPHSLRSIASHHSQPFSRRRAHVSPDLFAAINHRPKFIITGKFSVPVPGIQQNFPDHWPMDREGAKGGRECDGPRLRPEMESAEPMNGHRCLACRGDVQAGDMQERFLGNVTLSAMAFGFCSNNCFEGGSSEREESNVMNWT